MSFNNSARLSKISNFLLTGSFDSLLKKANSDHWYNTDYIHPCSIKDFKKLATDLDLKIISTFDVLSQKKFENERRFLTFLLRSPSVITPNNSPFLSTITAIPKPVLVIHETV